MSLDKPKWLEDAAWCSLVDSYKEFPRYSIEELYRLSVKNNDNKKLMWCKQFLEHGCNSKV